MKKILVTVFICILAYFINRSLAGENNLIQVFSVDPLKNNKPQNICETMCVKAY